MRLRVAPMFGLMILGGCQDNTAEPSKPEPPRIEMSIAASAPTFSTTEPLVVEVTATNAGGQTLDLGHGSSSCWLGLRAHKDGKPVDLGLGFVCTTDWVHKTLEPGTERTESIYLDGVRWYETPYRTLQPGVYELFGTLREHSSEPIVVEFLGGPIPTYP